MKLITKNISISFSHVPAVGFNSSEIGLKSAILNVYGDRAVAVPRRLIYGLGVEGYNPPSVTGAGATAFRAALVGYYQAEPTVGMEYLDSMAVVGSTEGSLAAKDVEFAGDFDMTGFESPIISLFVHAHTKNITNAASCVMLFRMVFDIYTATIDEYLRLVV